MTKIDNLLLIDIETVPLFASYDELSDPLKKHWDKKSLLLDKENMVTASTFAERAGIYAEFGKIVCIGLGYFIQKEGANTLHVKSIAGDDEKKILEEFKEVCNKFFKQADKQFCGHNIREFDIPFICRRFFVNQITLPDILIDLQNKKPWENPMLDTLQFWKFGEYKNFTSVDLLATILAIESPKDDIDGSEVAQVYWKENNLARIVNYCCKDVITVAQIFMRLNGLPLLQADDIIIREQE